MPINPARVAEAVAHGLSFVCAACEHYWEAVESDAPGCQFKCGSPIAGDVFHAYKGPLAQFDQFCFACGQPSTHAVRVAGLVRVIGCCEKHVELVKTLKAENLRPIAVTIKSKGGGEDTSDVLIRPKVKLRLG